MKPLPERVRGILLRPRETWNEITSENTDASALFSRYVLWLAAIPAVAAFIGGSLVGVGVFGVTVRVPLVTGLVQMVVGYVFSLIGIVLLGWIVNALASRFGAQADSMRALRLAAYSATAALVGGVFAVLPALSLLGVLFGLYSLYLLYLGLPVLMRNPPERSLSYTVAIVVCMVLIGLVLSLASRALLPDRVLPGADVSIADSPSDVFADAAQTQALAEAMIGNTRERLRQAVAEEHQRSRETPADVADDPAPVADPAPVESAYGLGKRKLSPPEIDACMTQDEIDAAAFGTGCRCDCDAYARGVERRCLAACGLAYYACWAPDPTDAELAQQLDPQMLAMLQQMPPEERAALRQGYLQVAMTERASQWMEQSLRCPVP